MNVILYIALCLQLLCGNLCATQLIQGNVQPSTCPTAVTETFEQQIETTAYDRANGIFYVGLSPKEEEPPTGDYAVSSFQRTWDANSILKFKARATDNILQNQSIKLLAMATNTGDTCSRVAGVKDGATSVFILDIANTVKESDDLLGYTGTLNVGGPSIDEIVSLEANRCFIFAAVVAENDSNNGIAVVAINQETLALNQTAAVPGDMGIKAQQFNNSSSQLLIGGSTITMTDNPILVWDDQLCRLYAGASLGITSNNIGVDGARSVAVGQVGTCPENGTLVFRTIAPDNAFLPADEEYVVGIIPNQMNANLKVEHLAVMHCSTGPSYLIVHGGNGTDTNQIYALPLVDRCDPDDEEQGRLADINFFNVATHRFTTPATGPNQLAVQDDQFAQVGNGPMPIAADQTISDMQVIGDTVYVSFKIPQDNSNETGIFYSQAQFDNEGKIQSWTPWTKRVWPICGFPNSPSQAQVSFFAVDAVTGKVIAVNGEPQKTVRITEWDNGEHCCPCSDSCALAAVLDRSLCNGAYSVLDLDQSTRGLGTSTPFRYALFGGTNKVDFALTSTSRAPAAPFDLVSGTDIPSPQSVTTDYCCSDVFLETPLPHAGCITTLEYARRTEEEGATNYFFAGTEKGLYAFAKADGSGFALDELGLLSNDLFSLGQWHKVAFISDPVIDIKTSGNTLYIMTVSTSCETPLLGQIRRVDFTDNLSTMFNFGTVFTIASSTEDSLSDALKNTLVFTQMQIVQTSQDGTQEQLVITTNNGLFQSKKDGGVQNAIDQIEPAWTLVGNQSLYYGIGAVDNPTIASTLWPFDASDACGCKTFERSTLFQLNGELADEPTFTFVPQHFNHLITCDSCECTSVCDQVSTGTDTDSSCCICPQLFEKICYFWSDGARRFFIISPSNAKLACIPCCGKRCCSCCPLQQLNALQVTPFNTCAWNVCNPLNTVLKDCILRTIPAFYWVRPIGVTGVILAGNQCGVVALE